MKNIKLLLTYSEGWQGAILMATRFIWLQKQGELGRQQSHFSLADGGGGRWSQLRRQQTLWVSFALRWDLLSMRAVHCTVQVRDEVQSSPCVLNHSSTFKINNVGPCRHSSQFFLSRLNNRTENYRVDRGERERRGLQKGWLEGG
jgi:hypothetical protein